MREDQPGTAGAITRRRLLKGAGTTALVAGSAPLISACGSSSTSSSHGGGSTATAATTTSGGASGGDIASQLRQILDLPTGKAAGQGLTIPVGASMAFSGPSSIYGQIDYAGITLAVNHIKALGGPNLQVQARDNGLADPAKGVANAREWGNAGVPIVLTSGGATGFSELPYYPQYKMVGIEAGGATKINEGKPFFYQTRSEYPTDMMQGIVEYVKAKHPSFKKALWCTLDYGTAIDDAQESGVKAVLTGAGYQYLGKVLAPPTSTDYSAMLSSIRQANPDFVVCLFPGALAGIFMKQYATSGLNTQIIGQDYTPDAQKIAGSAMNNYEFAFDYFDANNPPNQWAKLFVSEYGKANKGALPTYYSANYYESTFLIWQLIREIIAKGGDPTKQGTAYVDAIAANPAFPSLYGGNGAAHGMKVIGLQTHSLVRVPMVYASVNGSGTVSILATFNKGGTNFKLGA